MELFGKQYQDPGTMPGTLNRTDSSNFSLISVEYNSQHYIEETELSDSSMVSQLHDPSVKWIHVQGTPPLDVLQQIADKFNLHRLHLEDILNVGQRPKINTLGEQIFIILNLASFEKTQVSVSQLCVFLGDQFVVSFSPEGLNPFDKIYERLRKSLGKIRNRGADYLFYALIDTVIDHGFPLLEEYSEQIEDIEEQLIDQPDADLLQQIHRIRRELLLLHRRLWPHNEIIRELLHIGGDNSINSETQVYLRDCYDHSIFILDLLETYREMVASMLDVYLSSVSRRLNEVMRVLTVIATLFIPPTFVVGVYGMNFDRNASVFNMPELGWGYGYLFVWGVILFLVCGMLVYFRRKKWF